jgi:hypothetical protein
MFKITTDLFHTLCTDLFVNRNKSIACDHDDNVRNDW